MSRKRKKSAHQVSADELTRRGRLTYGVPPNYRDVRTATPWRFTSIYSDSVVPGHRDGALDTLQAAGYLKEYEPETLTWPVVERTYYRHQGEHDDLEYVSTVLFFSFLHLDAVKTKDWHTAIATMHLLTEQLTAARIQKPWKATVSRNTNIARTAKKEKKEKKKERIELYQAVFKFYRCKKAPAVYSVRHFWNALNSSSFIKNLEQTDFSKTELKKFKDFMYPLPGYRRLLIYIPKSLRE